MEILCINLSDDAHISMSLKTGFVVQAHMCASCLCLQHMLAEVWVQKTSEMDSGHQYHCRTFLGHLLNIGDLVLGSVHSPHFRDFMQKTGKYVDSNMLFFLPQL